MDLLENILQKHADNAANKLGKNHPDAVSFLQKKGITAGNIRDHAARLLTSGTLAASLILASPGMSHVATQGTQLATLKLQERQKQFSKQLQIILQNNEWTLTSDQEEQIRDLIHSYWGISATPHYDAHRLNTAYGLMGAEQHLPRYPGDSVEDHNNLLDSGITPSTGAWSYFAHSKTQLNTEDIEREKYYVAVQTLYLPDWNTNTKELKEWYKYRKVVVVNPKNGKTIICDIADAGPSQYTGKHFGGSPEVMQYLELDTGMKKGAVVLFFLDDHETAVPLGPVEYNESIGPV